MRVLFAIPHYVRPASDVPAQERKHGSTHDGVARRVAALTACLHALHSTFRPAHWAIDHGQCAARDAVAALLHHVDIVICTTSSRHVLDQLPPGLGPFAHWETTATPEMLGFACHDVLAARLGQYDAYCYLEDDLILRDPWWFVKLAWFVRHAGQGGVLQPNRFETGVGHALPKVYIDGDLAEHVTHPFQDISDTPDVVLDVMGQRVKCTRTLNPHAGCFFLSAAQMAHWSAQPHFRDRASRLIGPLETAATLGVLRTFKVYKPALANANFLELQHFGTGYLEQLVDPAKGVRP